MLDTELNMLIAITGTPGTGKSTFTKLLAKRINAIVLNGNEIIEKYSLQEGFDKRRDCNIVDAKKFGKACIKEYLVLRRLYKGHDMIIDSHLSHHIPKHYVSLCIVCRAKLSTLKKRLSKRRYKKQKILENMDAEIFEVCLQEAKDFGHRIIEYDSEMDNLTEIIKTLVSIKDK